jgi:microcystin-dependent protein
MPSTNGVYTLPLGYLAVTGATIQASQHNPPLEDIAQALTGRLSRDGTAAMVGALQLQPGTVGAPGAVFSTDLASGLYKTTAGIGVAIAGVKALEFTATGIASGVWIPGMLMPFTGSAAPNALWLLPFGQTVSRTAYPALWTFAQAEITAGNTLYNNGDGSTTFGIPDMRGRVPAGADAMGGTAASRLTTASGMSGSVLGSTGGAQTVTLTAAQIPSLSVSVGVSGSISGSAATNALSFTPSGSAAVALSPSGPAQPTAVSGSFSGSGSGSTTNTGGAAHSNVQPTLVCNYILFAGGAS